jgi:hypothetical protein
LLLENPLQREPNNSKIRTDKQYSGGVHFMEQANSIVVTKELLKKGFAELGIKAGM